MLPLIVVVPVTFKITAPPPAPAEVVLQFVAAPPPLPKLVGAVDDP
jgi:Ni,Fe-hydrogenase III small subunit